MSGAYGANVLPATKDLEECLWLNIFSIQKLIKFIENWKNSEYSYILIYSYKIYFISFYF
jgi:hypothetical protein